jgi:hypothetical protein
MSEKTAHFMVSPCMRKHFILTYIDLSLNYKTCSKARGMGIEVDVRMSIYAILSQLAHYGFAHKFPSRRTTNFRIAVLRVEVKRST